MFANVLRNSMNTAWNPWVFDKLSDEKTGDIKKASYMYLLAFFVLCMGLIGLAPEILLIIGGTAYKSAVYVVPPVVAAYMFSMVYSLYAGIEQYYKKQKYFALVATICAGLNIFLNLVFIPLFGYIAAAYTTLASTALECFLHYLNVRKMKMDGIYNTRFNLIIIMLMLFVSTASIWIYKNDVLRYSIIGIISVFVFTIAIIKRSELKKLINRTIWRKE